MPQPTTSVEQWGREAMLYLRKYGNLFPMGKSGECRECTECGASISLDKTHYYHCPLARLIAQGEQLFNEENV
jgi:hypothetical protein